MKSKVHIKRRSQHPIFNPGFLFFLFSLPPFFGTCKPTICIFTIPPLLRLISLLFLSAIFNINFWDGEDFRRLLHVDLNFFSVLNSHR
jgi:hypothetical protein